MPQRRPAFMRWLPCTWIPWPGVTSILVIGCCAAASTVVLVVTHDKIARSHAIEPSVLLSILSAIANVAFTAALATGVAISFWRAAQQGATLAQLHHIWAHNRGIEMVSSVNVGGPQARRVAIVAALVYMVQFASGPLLQQSTRRTIEDRIVLDETLKIDIAERIPDGFFGTRQTGRVVGFKRVFPAVQGWLGNQTIPTRETPGYFCNGKCEGNVAGAGFMANCSSETREMDLMDPDTDEQPVFQISPALSGDSLDTQMNLTITYSSHVDANCIATVTTDTCQIRAAIVPYPVRMLNATIGLAQELLPSMEPISLYGSHGDAPDATNNVPAGPLAGLYNFVSIWLNDNSTKFFNQEADVVVYFGTGFYADKLLMWDRDTVDAGAFDRGCALVWPANSGTLILNTMHDFMFRAALVSGDRANETHEFSVTRVAPTLVYTSDAKYLAAGLCTILLGAFLVGSLMWGWWSLGHAMTLSPLEVGKALRAPVFWGLPRDSTIQDILAFVKDVPFHAVSDEEYWRERRVVNGEREKGAVGVMVEESPTSPSGHLQTKL